MERKGKRVGREVNLRKGEIELERGYEIREGDKERMWWDLL